jgi:hypothetical protein
MTVNRKYNMYHNILRRAISYLNDALRCFKNNPENRQYINSRIEWTKEEIDIAMKNLTKLL